MCGTRVIAGFWECAHPISHPTAARGLAQDPHVGHSGYRAAASPPAPSAPPAPAASPRAPSPPRQEALSHFPEADADFLHDRHQGARPPEPRPRVPSQ